MGLNMLFGMVLLACITGGWADGCGGGWFELGPEKCGAVEPSNICVKVGRPLKYVSWFHLNYECDVIGGYLPQPTDGNKVQLELILQSYDLLYGSSLMYLGATDFTYQNGWKWMGTKNILEGSKEVTNWEGNTPPNAVENMDCLAQSSATKLWTNIDCMDDSRETQIAFICTKAKGATETETEEKEKEDAKTSSCSTKADCSTNEVCYLQTKTCVCDKTSMEVGGACQPIKDQPCEGQKSYTDNDGYYVIPFCSAWKEHGQHGTVQLGTYTEGTGTQADKMLFKGGSNVDCSNGKKRSAYLEYVCFCEDYTCDDSTKSDAVGLFAHEPDVACQYEFLLFTMTACSEKIA